MTNKELQDWLSLWEDELPIPDNIAIPVVQLGAHFENERAKLICAKSKNLGEL